MHALIKVAQLVTIVTAMLILAGCSPSDDESVAPESAVVSPTPVSSSPLEVPSPAKPAVDVTGIPLDIDCLDLLSLETLYEYNPNVGTDPNIKPSVLGERALANGGVACGWSNQSSGEPLTAAVARFDMTDLETVRVEALAVPGSQELSSASGVFRRDGNTGIVEAFSGDYWIVLESPVFLEPSDVQDILDSIQGSLPRT